jgi:hypothetical protein
VDVILIRHCRGRRQDAALAVRPAAQRELDRLRTQSAVFPYFRTQREIIFMSVGLPVCLSVCLCVAFLINLKSMERASWNPQRVKPIPP